MGRKRRRRKRRRRRRESTQAHIHAGHRHTWLTPPLWYRLQEEELSEEEEEEEEEGGRRTGADFVIAATILIRAGASIKELDG